MIVPLFLVSLSLWDLAQCALVKHTFVVEEWVVDFMRPTVPDVWGASRKSPFKIPEEQRKNALLVNGMYPGPTVECFEDDVVEINVINKLMSEEVTIHWHGVHMVSTPWEDGARGVTQAGIMPGQNYTYTFKAFPPGTHYWHAHMDAVQSAKGLKGPFIIKKHDDPFKDMYDLEQVVAVSDEWRDPSVCLKNEGAMPGNDVCSDVRHASFNGRYGNGTRAYPFPLIEVQKGKCHRMRWIFMGVNTENFIISLAGHSMTLIAIDGYDVKPLQITQFNMHLGERYDVIVCADQEPGNYLIKAIYDYACRLVEGNFIPPGFSAVPTCEFHAYLHYKGQLQTPKDLSGTGGGKSPRQVDGTSLDFTTPADWAKVTPLVAEPEPEEPDVRYVVNMGLIGPTYKNPTDAPLTKGRWYMDFAEHKPPRSFKTPTTPLLHTKGQCGVEDVPIMNVPEDAVTVEVVLQNLSPTAHVIHMHGMPFKVINVASYDWCTVDKVGCFLMPFFLNPCPLEDRQVSDPSNPFMVLGGYWGCKYNPKRHRASQNLATPIQKDMVQVWQRSWTVIRFKAVNPGYWFFHCHMEQHIPLGMQMVINVKPSQQPPVPTKVPTSGWCPKWNEKDTLTALLAENAELKARIAQLEH
jgi:L-ascorbate oxidase